MSRSTATKARTENGMVRYFKDTRAEISKVTWPTREEGVRLTWVVIVVTIISAIFLFGVDSVFSFLIATLLRAV